MSSARGWLDPRGAARAALETTSGEHDALLPPKVIERLQQLEMGEAHLLLVWELVRLATGLDEAQRRAFALLVSVSLVNQLRGSTRLPLTGTRRHHPLRNLLSEIGATEDDVRSVRRLCEQIDPLQKDGPLGSLIGTAEQYRPLIAQDGHLYHQRMFELEGRVAARLAHRMHADAILEPSHVERLVTDVEAAAPRGPDGSPLKLSSEQRRAICAALSHSLTVITGGPGTGKTSIVVSILRALARRDDLPLDSVTLAAPTGKAADRMRASVDRALRRLDAPAFGDRALVADRPRAHTLHRLLGFSPRSGRFRHHPRNPLSHRFVIVDESSMIDLALMDRLLGAMPEDGQLVLLGDAHQLPSVDAGAVFRDLGQSGGPRIMTLTRSYRMDPRDPAGKNILTLARRIDAQDPDGLFEPHGRSKGSRSERIAIRSRQDEIRFEGVEWIETTTARGRERVLEHWYQQHVRSLPDLDSLTGRAWKVHGGQIAATGSADMARLFDHVDASRVLCLTRGRATGVNALNEWFHNRALRSAGTAAVASTGRLLLAGEPVLVQRNDYDKGLFNGDTGIVVRTVDEAEDETHPRHSVVFRREDGFLTFPLEAVRPLLDLAWAITVHKSQGSEYRHVAIVLPVTDTPLLTRELLYTAVTRSARSVLMMGPRAMLETGVRRALDRFSGVAPRLEGQAGQPG